MSEPGHILVVDDDADTRDSVADSLVDRGYQVVCAGDGIEALELLRAGPLPKLILLDYSMPRLGGAGFRAEMAKVEEWTSIPVVLLTADQNAERKAAEINATAFMQKPIKPHALFEVIATLFQKSP
ncbi:MAG: response regulator [Myxococcaceae bacterium]